MASFAEQMAAAEVTVRQDMNRFFRSAIAISGERLVGRSPIDTGRFASNWRYGLMTPDVFTTEATAERFVHNLEELPQDAVDFSHHITNALPYGPALERGSSSQAPQGMAGLTSLEWPQIVALAIARGGASSVAQLS